MNKLQEKSSKTFKIYDLIKVNREAYLGSLESRASDPVPPSYIFKGPGTVLCVSGEYCLVRWHLLPAPDVWFATEQIEYY